MDGGRNGNDSDSLYRYFDKNFEYRTEDVREPTESDGLEGSLA
jgi:hypothetical protein